MSEDIQRSADSFDTEALRYDRIRPVPPPELIARLLERSGLGPGGRILEVGCGSGQLTLALAPYGFELHAIDIGARLLDLARRKLAPWPKVRFEQVAFEAFACSKPFDAIVSLQAFHWIEPSIGLAKAAGLLAPGGSLLLAWHLGAMKETAFYQATQPIYARYQGEPQGPAPESAPTIFARALSAGSDFQAPVQDVLPWSRTYTRAEYLDLLQTFSDILAMPTGPRASLLQAIGDQITAMGGSFDKPYRSHLLSSRRR